MELSKRAINDSQFIVLDSFGEQEMDKFKGSAAVYQIFKGQEEVRRIADDSPQL